MEWLKNRNLKQSFFIISAWFLCVGLLFAIASFLLCAKWQSAIVPYPRYEIAVGDNNEIISAEYTDAEQETDRISSLKSTLLTALQFALPTFFVVLSLLFADLTFWRLKLKKPLAELRKGAERIQRQDLDFEIAKCSEDELGVLCSAFEKMRMELLNNNRELWRQIEERKRLNAAFSHDLRNPVTVLKGSAALLQKYFMSKRIEDANIEANVEANIEANLALITAYTGRIESYVEAMTMAQKLEDWKCTPMPARWPLLAKELAYGLSFLRDETEKQITFSIRGADEQIYADKAIVQNVAENLVSNALRYADTVVHVALSYSAGKLAICVTDDGGGFPSAILNEGVRPFLSGGEAQAHFGMGLYVCRLLCKKHGGELEIENAERGAKAIASFHVLQP